MLPFLFHAISIEHDDKRSYFVNFVLMQVFSVISLWWLLPIAVLAVLISFLYYRNQSQLADASKSIRFTLFSLRSLSLIILSILLLGMIIEYKTYREEKPMFIFLVDDSISMLNYSDSTKVESRIRTLKDEINKEYSDRFEFKEFFISDIVRDSSQKFGGLVSDLDKGFDFIRNRYYNRNIGAICFISDGVYNEGKNPVYSAQRLNLTPVFAIGVGDTIQKKDQLIRNVSVNNIAFLNNQFPIEVDLEAHKMNGASTKISLWSGDIKLSEQTIQYSQEDQDLKHVQFVVEATYVGFKPFRLQLNKEINESTFENNERRFYVDIIDSRSKILLLADAPHPDVSAIAQTLKTDENIEVESKLLEEGHKSKFEKYALVIWHGGINNEYGKDLEKLVNSKVPVLFMLTANSNSSVLKKMGISIQAPNSTSFDEVQVSFNSAFQLFELKEETKASIKRFPPLKVRFGNYAINGGDVLFSQKIGSVEKKDPVIGFSNLGSVKVGFVFGEGLWKWKINDFVESGNHNSFNEIIKKSIQYLTVKRNTDPLQIQLPRRFNVVDDILINATFYNSSFDPIIDPEISFKIKDEKGIDQSFSFAKSSKSYYLNAGKLKEGQYEWIAEATHNGKKYSKNGMFIVENVSIEKLSTHAEHNSLSQIAEKTNGKFYRLEKSSQLLKDINAREDIATMSYEEAEFLELIDWKLLFALLALLFTCEWFIRRYFGSY